MSIFDKKLSKRRPAFPKVPFEYGADVVDLEKSIFMT